MFICPARPRETPLLSITWTAFCYLSLEVKGMSPVLLPLHTFHGLTCHPNGTHAKVPLSSDVLGQLFPWSIFTLFVLLAKAQTISEINYNIKILPRFPNRFNNLVAPLDISVGVCYRS